jgi:hypothetical protein
MPMMMTVKVTCWGETMFWSPLSSSILTLDGTGRQDITHGSIVGRRRRSRGWKVHRRRGGSLCLFLLNSLLEDIDQLGRETTRGRNFFFAVSMTFVLTLFALQPNVHGFLT